MSRVALLQATLGRLWDVVPAKRILLEPLRRWANLPEPIFRHLHFHGVFTVRAGAGSFRLRHHGTQIENELYWRGLEGGWEPATLGLWLRLAARVATVVDVGANAGVFALAAHAVNPRARVWAVEPVERCFERLRGNCRLNGGGVEPVLAAASDRDGVAELIVPEVENPLSASLEVGHAGDLPVHRARVRTLRLETLLGPAPEAPLLVKVDVEGHEAAAVRGLGRLLGDVRPTLVVEVLPGDTAAALTALLAPHGYRYFHIHESAGPVPVEAIHSLPGGWNYLCCQPEVAEDLGLDPSSSAASPAPGTAGSTTRMRV